MKKNNLYSLFTLLLSISTSTLFGATSQPTVDRVMRMPAKHYQARKGTCSSKSVSATPTTPPTRHPKRTADGKAPLEQIAQRVKLNTEPWQNIKDLTFRCLFTLLIANLDYEDASTLGSKSVYLPCTSIWPNVTSEEFRQISGEQDQFRLPIYIEKLGKFIYPQSLCHPLLLGSHDRINYDLGTYSYIKLAQTPLLFLTKLNQNTSAQELEAILGYLTQFFYNFYPLIDTTTQEKIEEAAAIQEDEFIKKLLPICWQSANGTLELIKNAYTSKSQYSQNRKALLLGEAKEKLPSNLYNELVEEFNRLPEFYSRLSFVPRFSPCENPTPTNVKK